MEILQRLIALSRLNVLPSFAPNPQERYTFALGGLRVADEPLLHNCGADYVVFPPVSRLRVNCCVTPLLTPTVTNE